VSARIIAALVVALGLVSGVLIGIAADRLLLLPSGHRHSVAMMREPSAPGILFGPQGSSRMPGGRPPEPSADWVTDRLAEQLDLTPEQRTRVDSIVTRRMAQRRAIMEPVRERMRQLFDSTRMDVDAVLTPAQRAKLDQMHMRSGGPASGPPPGPGGPPPSR
jgi:Spy/CpxP family protein refolding chaperone